MRRTRSLGERLADAAKREALKSMTLTERLLVQIWIELMDTRTRRNHVQIGARLTVVGLSQQQIAALLDTTPAALAVAKRRKRSDEGAAYEAQG